MSRDISTVRPDEEELKIGKRKKVMGIPGSARSVERVPERINERKPVTAGTEIQADTDRREGMYPIPSW